MTTKSLAAWMWLILIRVTLTMIVGGLLAGRLARYFLTLSRYLRGWR